MDVQEKTLFAESLTDIITSTPAGGLRDAIDEFGWADLLVEETADAVSTVFPLLGRHVVPPILLDDVVVAAAGEEPGAGTAVVYPAVPDIVPTSTAVVRGDQVELTITGVVVSAAAAPARVLVPAVVGVETIVIAAVNWIGPWPSAGHGIDPDSRWAVLETTITVPASDLVGGGDAGSQWATMRAAGQRALAHEMGGIGAVMLDLAREHVASREQFGRVLAGFQVVRHKLADVRLWQEAAALAADAAWEDGRPESAALAKSLAGRFLKVARENCQQLLGGMGFTWEHDFHRYLTRALVLESLLGSSAVLRAQLGAELRDPTAAFPRLADL